MEYVLERRQNILIVDDFKFNLRLLGGFLQDDYNISVANSGEEALEKVKSDSPDLILLDIVMPEMDGYEVCRRLKEDQATSRIPVIFITSKDTEDDEVTGLAAGAVDYITKPFRLPIIRARVKTQLDLKHKTDALEMLYRRLDEEINKARNIHERTFPANLPLVQGISLCAYYQPAHRLGGDFYDVIHIGNKLLIYLSDVSGHGLDGAMLSIFVKETIDSYISLMPDAISPHQILSHLYSQFCRKNLDSDYFISIFMALLDLDINELTYSGAGFQAHPLLKLGCGGRLSLATEGPPVSSVFPRDMMIFKEFSIRLDSGSTILFATDGLFDQEAGNTIYMKRVMEKFYTSSHLSPELIVQEINNDFRQFNGGSLQGDDDITLLLLKLK